MKESEEVRFFDMISFCLAINEWVLFNGGIALMKLLPKRSMSSLIYWALKKRKGSPIPHPVLKLVMPEVSLGYSPGEFGPLEVLEGEGRGGAGAPAITPGFPSIGAIAEHWYCSQGCPAP